MDAHNLALHSAAISGWPLAQQEILLEDALTHWCFAKRYQDAYQAAIKYGFAPRAL